MAGKQKRAVWNEVACKAHGRAAADNSIPNSVRLSSKGTRAERQGKIGCPVCRREKSTGATAE